MKSNTNFSLYLARIMIAWILFACNWNAYWNDLTRLSNEQLMPSVPVLGEMSLNTFSLLTGVTVYIMDCYNLYGIYSTNNDDSASYRLMIIILIAGLGLMVGIWLWTPTIKCKKMPGSRYKTPVCRDICKEKPIFYTTREERINLYAAIFVLDLIQTYLAVSYNSSTFGNWAAAGSGINQYLTKLRENNFSDAEKSTIFYDYITFGTIALSGPLINLICLYSLTTVMSKNICVPWNESTKKTWADATFGIKPESTKFTCDNVSTCTTPLSIPIYKQ